MNHPTPFGDHTAAECNDLYGGIQYCFKFDNGYGASVIRHGYSYGGDIGLWELAVLGADGHLNYDTPITDDVLGRLTEDEVAVTLVQIATLVPVAS